MIRAAGEGSCEMAGEPVTGQPGGGIEGTGFFEQVSGAGHHGQLALAPQRGLGLAVEAEHHIVTSADGEQRRRRYQAEASAREIGMAAAGYHGRKRPKRRSPTGRAARRHAQGTRQLRRLWPG